MDYIAIGYDARKRVVADGGDYKDVAAATCNAVFQAAMLRLDSDVRGIVHSHRHSLDLLLRSMPDGHGCPREFNEWWSNRQQDVEALLSK